MVSPVSLKRKFTKKEISQLFLKAKRVVFQPGLVILLAPSVSITGRLLIITPAKIGNAPDRNRIRRRLKALFFEQHFLDQPFDWIIIVKKAGIDLEYNQLESIVNQAYQKAQSKKESDESH